MSEPSVVYTVREILDHIEDRLKHLEEQVSDLNARAASAGTVRRAMWTAATSPLLAVGLTWWIARK